MISKQPYQRGQWTLIGLLVAVAIAIGLSAMYVPRIAATHSAPNEPMTPKERANGAACSAYLSQMDQAVSLYKSDHDDQPPPNIDALRRYGVTDDILHAPGCTFTMDPATGKITDLGGGKSLPPGQAAPAGVPTIPSIPDPNATGGQAGSSE